MIHALRALEAEIDAELRNLRASRRIGARLRGHQSEQRIGELRRQRAALLEAA